MGFVVAFVAVDSSVFFFFFFLFFFLLKHERYTKKLSKNNNKNSVAAAHFKTAEKAKHQKQSHGGPNCLPVKAQY